MPRDLDPKRRSLLNPVEKLAVYRTLKAICEQTVKTINKSDIITFTVSFACYNIDNVT